MSFPKSGWNSLSNVLTQSHITRIAFTSFTQSVAYDALLKLPEIPSYAEPLSYHRRGKWEKTKHVLDLCIAICRFLEATGRICSLSSSDQLNCNSVVYGTCPNWSDLVPKGGLKYFSSSVCGARVEKEILFHIYTKSILACKQMVLRFYEANERWRMKPNLH